MPLSRIWLSVPPAFAGDSELERTSLRGLKGIKILVEKMPPQLENDGLNRKKLIVDIESRLKKAGIEVFNEEEVKKIPGLPYLYLNVNAVKNPRDKQYSYNIVIELKQVVLLRRNPTISVFGTTWSTSRTGTVELKRLSKMRDDTITLLDIFIKEETSRLKSLSNKNQ